MNLVGAEAGGYDERSRRLLETMSQPQRTRTGDLWHAQPMSRHMFQTATAPGTAGPFGWQVLIRSTIG